MPLLLSQDETGPCTAQLELGKSGSGALLTPGTVGKLAVAGEGRGDMGRRGSVPLSSEGKVGDITCFGDLKSLIAAPAVQCGGGKLGPGGEVILAAPVTAPTPHFAKSWICFCQ